MSDTPIFDALLDEFWPRIRIPDYVGHGIVFRGNYFRDFPSDVRTINCTWSLE